MHKWKNQSAGYLVNHVGRIFARGLATAIRPLGLTIGAFPALLELWETDGLTQSQLVERLDIEQATMANTLSRMERDGLVSRRRHPKDKRAQLVFLTARGKALQETALAAASATEDALFQGFRRFERELLLEYMRMVLANLGRDPRV